MLMQMAQAAQMPPGPTSDLAERVVRREQSWFSRPGAGGDPASMPKVVASRWTGFAGEGLEVETLIAADGPVVGITLRPLDMALFAAGKAIYDCRLPQGVFRINEPGLAMRGIYRGGYDTLHLHIPNRVIAEFLNSESGPSRSSTPSLASSQPASDPVIDRLGQALLHADDFGGAFDQCYADSIGLAIVARLLGRTAEAVPPSARISGLAKWRLKRAVDYISAHLSEPIGLADIAAATGLTRMHFAAQFRASTGLRPHEYLIRQRIERAQELLTTSRLPLVEIALEVGFKTQAHFTTVFAKIAGETPNVWRRERSEASAGFPVRQDRAA